MNDEDIRRPRHGPDDSASAAEGSEGESRVATVAAEEPSATSPTQRRGPLRTVLGWIGVAEQAIGAVLLVVILLLVLLQVGQRYAPGGGWAWTGEIARFGLVWMTVALSGYLLEHDEHIALEVVDYVASPRGLRIVRTFVHVVVALTCIGMVYESLQLITTRSGQVTPAARIPLAWIYVIPLFGFALTTLRAVLMIFLGPLDEHEDEMALVAVPSRAVDPEKGERA